MVTNAGSVAAFGGVAYAGSLGLRLSHPVVAMAKAPGAKGYWLASASGRVYPIGAARYYGSLRRGALARANPVVGMVRAPDGKGYWLVTAAGDVFSFGDARFYGSLGLTRLGSKVVGMARTPDGRGYWLVTAAGGVWSFGDARYFGSAPSVHLRSPVVGIAPTPDGAGYRLATASGAVFAFGDAKYLGGAPSRGLSAPIVAIVASPRGQGYWLVGADGGVLTFGNAPFRGSGHGTLPYGQAVVAMVPSPGVGVGVTSAGAFGPTSPSPLHRSTPPAPRRTPKPAPKQAPKPVRLVGPASYPDGATGYDVSWPQCHGPLPPPARVAVVGVNGGLAFTANPCFEHEARWAGHNITTYINLNSPRGPNPAEWQSGPAGRCKPGALYCESYNFGYNTAQYSVRSAEAHGTQSKTWWLDVETAGGWSFSQEANAKVVAGAIAALERDRLHVAIYSTNYQWDIITGGYVPGTSAWYPTGRPTKQPGRWCAPTSFAGGPVSLVQRPAGRFDGDYSC
jgi:hypothetical protein